MTAMETMGDLCGMSPVTVAELSAGVENTQDQDVKARRQAALTGRLQKEGRARVSISLPAASDPGQKSSYLRHKVRQ